MSHIQFCLDEIVAEVSAAIDRVPAAAALARIEEREAAGAAAKSETLSKSALEAELLQHPYVAALDKIAELRAILTAAEAGRGTVIELAAHRAKAAPQAASRAAPVRRTFRAVSGVAVAAACLIAVLVTLPAARTPAAGLAVEAVACFAGE